MIMPGQDDLYFWKAGWLQPIDAYIADPKLTGPNGIRRISFSSFTKASTVEGKQIGVVNQCRDLAAVVSQGPLSTVQCEGFLKP